MNKKLIIIIVLLGLLLGSSIGLLAYSINSSREQNNTKTATSVHAHPAYEVKEGEIQPQLVTLDIAKDAKSGWNLKINTLNFEFTPENVNQDHIPGQGHAHLYIDGQKITRLYSENYYISGYEDGVHEIEVTLNTNKHEDYYVLGQKVSQMTKLVGDHSHNNNEPEGHGH